jgi:hypothetical protein
MDGHGLGHAARTVCHGMAGDGVGWLLWLGCLFVAVFGGNKIIHYFYHGLPVMMVIY